MAIKVTTREEAWKLVKALVGDTVLDTGKNAKIDYPTYEILNQNGWVSDLGNSLEVNVQPETMTVQSVRIWIEEEMPDKKSECKKLYDEIRSAKKEIEYLKGMRDDYKDQLSKKQEELEDLREKVRRNDIPQEIWEELYNIAYDKETQATMSMERAAEGMLNAIEKEEKEAQQIFAEQYRDNRTLKARYGKIVDQMELRERKRAATQ